MGTSRRGVLSSFLTAGAAGAALPELLVAQAAEAGANAITVDTLRAALQLAGLTLRARDEKAMLQSVNRRLAAFQELRQLSIPPDVAPPFSFNPLTPGMKVNRTRQPLRFSTPQVKRPARLQEVAYWPVAELAQLIKSRQVTSVELTRLYLDRLHRYNTQLNCVVTFLDDLALAQARQADEDLAAGRYRSVLHGIPWGAKDIIAVQGHRTTWGSGAFRDQISSSDASVVRMLREAGAVLLAKLTTGELAQGDNWFGGQTKNPWKLDEGSSGSSAGPAAATAAGLVGFAIGTETSGSILSPAQRCGVTGLRPTFGRISRHGVMALSWTQDRLGPMCRHAEDCALVMSVIARPDDLDLSVSELPFNYNARRDVRALRVGYLAQAFAETKDDVIRSIEQAALEQVRKLGVELVPMEVPEWTVDVSAITPESAAFFDESVRSGRDQQMTNYARGEGFRSGRLIPAVEYLQSQRARSMMMQRLAAATAKVDVYLAPSGTGLPPAARTGTEAVANPPAARTQQAVTLRHFTMANLAGYPAIAIPSGWTTAGTPCSVVFYARPFGEAELLVLAKAYQDATGHYRRQPNLDGSTSA